MLHAFHSGDLSACARNIKSHFVLLRRLRGQLAISIPRKQRYRFTHEMSVQQSPNSALVSEDRSPLPLDWPIAASILLQKIPVNGSLHRRNWRKFSQAASVSYKAGASTASNRRG